MRTLGSAIVASLLLAGPARTAEADAMRTPVPSVTVVGSGKASAKPDLAEIQVGVVTQATTAAKALKDNTHAMTELFKAVKARGVADKDMQTSNFSINPMYRRGNQQADHGPEIVGYQVNNQIHIKVRQLASLGDVLDDVVTAGSNQIHGISFSVAEPAGLLDEARRKAMADARRKAELYAKAANVSLGDVLLIEEQSPHIPRPMFGAAPMARAAEAVPIATGEQDFGASITVTYRLK